MKRMKTSRPAAPLMLLAPLTMAFSLNGLAQNDAALEEIIVTAERRETSVQDVPITINVFSGERLEKSGMENIMDLEMITPGISFAAIGSSGRLSIRGIGSPILQGPGADPSSAIYVDGVYQSRFTASILELLDPERIEVLKGPQGTLYGRNATGGAINYISEAPTSELGGEISVRLGNYNLREIKTEANVPLSDSLLFRGAVMRMERDGYTENLLVSGDEIDKGDITAGHFTLKYLPSDTTDITLRVGITRDRGDNPSRKIIELDPPPGSFYEEAAIIDDPRKIMANQIKSEAPISTDAFSLTVKSDLGWAELSSITGYTDLHNGPYREDWDATEIYAIQQGLQGVSNGYEEVTKTYSQEFTLSSTDTGKLQWLTGLFFLRDEPYVLTGLHQPQFTPIFITREGDNKVNAYAAFTNMNYHFTDKLRLNAGLRYSYEEKEFTLSRYFDGVIVAGPNTEKDDWSAWTPKIGLDYFLTDDVMLYGSASRGFKSGGFNTNGAEIPGESVAPEYINAYEIGVKITVLDGRMRLIMIAFDYDYSDLQVQSRNEDIETGVGLKLQNAAKATINGAEVELSLLPIDALQLDLGLSWLDATYDDFETLSPTDEPVNVKGNSLPQAPEVTASVGLEYILATSTLGEFRFRTDYYYSDKRYFNEFNDWYNLGLEVMPSYSLVNARIDFSPSDGGWAVGMYGKNLTDELVYTSIVADPPTIGPGILVTLNPPRTYGLSLDYEF